MDKVIECTEVTRVFSTRGLLGKKQETHALNGISFSIPKGIVFGLLGPNGSGKTTTIRILSTLLTPTTGQAKVLGFDVVKESARVRGRIGLILGGERGLYGRLTAEENLKYFAALNHLSREKTRERVKEILEMVNLTEAAKRPVEQYSRGMRQRLHIARGLLTDPEVLFMDEPTIGLDPAGARELRQLVPTLVQRGKTILLTTHYMSEADELSNEVAIINKGRLIASGTPRDIKRSFSKITVCEAICRQTGNDISGKIQELSGVQNIYTSQDGPLQRLTIHVLPGTEIKMAVVGIIGEANIESVVMRDPTLEEAYLSIIK
jgi:ABC-2 type transport system ATP-binding protein